MHIATLDGLRSFVCLADTRFNYIVKTAPHSYKGGLILIVLKDRINHVGFLKWSQKLKTAMWLYSAQVMMDSVVTKSIPVISVIACCPSNKMSR